MEKIIADVKNGKKEAYSVLIKEYQQELFNIAKNRTLNEEDAKDVVQETIIKGYLNINQLRNNKYFKTWIVKILINECNKFYLNKKNEDEMCSKYARNIEKSENEELFEDNSIDNIIKELDSLDKKIFKMYYEEGYTIDNISKILDINVNTVKSKLNRGKKKISRLYKYITMVIVLVFVLTTGLVFGQDLINYILNLFNNRDNTNILRAIREKKLVQEINMNYIDINENYSIKVEYILVDEKNIYVVFELISNIDFGKYYQFSITDLKFSTENGTILDDESEVEKDQCAYLRGWQNIEHSKNKIKELIYIMADEFPIMNELNLSFKKIVIYGKRGKRTEIELDNVVNINIILEEKLKNRNSKSYEFTPIKYEKYELIKAEYLDTGFYATVKSTTLDIDFIIQAQDGNIYQTSKTFVNISDKEHNFYYLVIADIKKENSKELLIMNKKKKNESVRLFLK